MPINWSQVQDALSAWVVATSGLNATAFGFDGSGEGFDHGDFADSAVLWVNQAAPQPRIPYATLKLSPARKVQGIDSLIITTDLSAPHGKEITSTVRGEREVTLTLEVLSNVVTGAGTALEFLGNCLTGLSLPSQRANLRAAGLSLVDFEAPIDLSLLVATAFQSRASCDVRFYLVDTQSETAGYIAEADMTTHIDLPPVVDAVVVLDVT